MGHPIHPILIPFPLGLLSTSVVFDVVHLLTGNGKWSEISFWMTAAGVIGGLDPAGFRPSGLVGLPPRPWAHAAGTWCRPSHGGLVCVVSRRWVLRPGGLEGRGNFRTP